VSENITTKKDWRVEIDPETCSLCEMCVNRCSNNALIVRREGGKLEIFYDHQLCDGCLGQTFCQSHCPENAVKVSRVPVEELPGAIVSLVSGELATCKSCGNEFMPERKLNTLLQKKKIEPKDIQKLCPACRREKLMDSYLDITGQA
jgi:NAD-dependent dihydropyrimidine dehydrogenase PreA subunit